MKLPGYHLKTLPRAGWVITTDSFPILPCFDQMSSGEKYCSFGGFTPSHDDSSPTTAHGTNQARAQTNPPGQDTWTLGGVLFPPPSVT